VRRINKIGGNVKAGTRGTAAALRAVIPGLTLRSWFSILRPPFPIAPKLNHIELRGRLLREHRFNVFQTTAPSTHVGWASLEGDPETGNVCAHGVGGMLICNNRDGKMLWSRSFTEEFGRFSAHGGRTQTPLDPYRSSPAITPINGRCPLVAEGADSAMYAVRVRAGECAGAIQAFENRHRCFACRRGQSLPCLPQRGESRQQRDGPGGVPRRRRNSGATKTHGGGAPANWKSNMPRRRFMMTKSASRWGRFPNMAKASEKLVVRGAGRQARAGAGTNRSLGLLEQLGALPAI